MDDLKHSRVTKWVPAVVSVVGGDTVLMTNDGEFGIKVLRPKSGLSDGENVRLALLFDDSMVVQSGGDNG